MLLPTSPRSPLVVGAYRYACPYLLSVITFGSRSYLRTQASVRRPQRRHVGSPHNPTRFLLKVSNPRFASGNLQPAVNRQPGYRRGDREAVSYTHLTLPTKRIV